MDPLKLPFSSQLLPRDTPGKVGGPPGDAFELVYTSVASPVRRKVHAVDPVLGEWIRLHLYGDVYSSPGLTLRQKELLMAARLAQANMAEQLFGHALAGLRFGASRGELEEAVGIGMAAAPGQGTPALEAVRREALKTLDMVSNVAADMVRGWCVNLEKKCWVESQLN